MCSVLDRVLVSPEWELLCPLASLRTITQIGSDHVPLLLSSENDRPPFPLGFGSKTFWLNQHGFVQAVCARWLEARTSPHRSNLVVGNWHLCTKRSRKFMEGWGGNLDQDLRERKKAILGPIQALDIREDSVGLSPDEWMIRYDLEYQLSTIYTDEEAYWGLRGAQKLVLWGDTNTAYFQAIANDRRMRNSIPCFGTVRPSYNTRPTSMLTSMDSPPRSGLALATDFWPNHQCVPDAEIADLTTPFSKAEVWTAIKGMNHSSAPGPNGLPVKFFHTIWNTVRHEVMALFEEVYVGSIDLHRLNYGIITLIPKVTDALYIRQFNPIMVINVVFRILVKGLGIMSFRHMNIALLARWLWRIANGDGGLWLRIIRNKYLHGQPLAFCHWPEGSQFWQSIVELLPVLRIGTSIAVGAGTSTLFWFDWWVGAAPFTARFPDQFTIVMDP
ncbi:putative NOT transcription complex subunit VIP2 [Hordeum vulgare]|nr:putative NOT transcription complex subunit VIP2 [Hordeum vulgare]